MCIFIIVVLLVNAGFFNHENNGTSTGISSRTAWAMIFLNLVFIIPVGILLAVSVYEVVKGTETANRVKIAASSVRKGALSTISTNGVRITRTVDPTARKTTTTEIVPTVPSPVTVHISHPSSDSGVKQLSPTAMNAETAPSRSRTPPSGGSRKQAVRK